MSAARTSRAVGIAWSVLLGVAALAFVGSSCSDGDNDDAGSDGDPDGGTDDESHVDCQAEPAACSDLGETEEDQYVGCCFGGSVYFCEGWELKTIDCEDNGDECGYNPDGAFMDCL